MVLQWNVEIPAPSTMVSFGGCLVLGGWDYIR